MGASLATVLMISRLQEELVRGPEEHPRYGRCLLVCPTIETARAGRFPTQALVVTSAARKLIALSKDGERLQSVLVVGGSHDPTSHPEFHQISQNLRELMNKWFPKASLTLISNSPDLRRAQVRHSLNWYDQPILRLPAGTQKTYVALTGEPPGEFKQIVENMGRLEIERLIVEGRFVRGEVDNTRETELRAWIRKVGEIRPAGVHITTPQKPTGSKVKPVTKTRMTQIAELVTEKTGIPVEVCLG